MSYRPGGRWRIDDRSGFKVRADDTVKQWDGLVVRKRDAEERHPQDFVVTRPNDRGVPDPQPAPIMMGDGAYFLVENDHWKGWRVYQEYVGGSAGQFRTFSGFDGVVDAGDLG